MYYADSASPQFEIVDIEDISYLGCVRKLVRLRTPSRLSEPDVLAVAQAVVTHITCKHKVNAISIFMYDTAHATGLYTLASVEWAPNADWAKAKEVRTGDYSRHDFNIHMSPERPPEPATVGGLALAEAKQCFLDLVRAQDRASAEVQVQHPHLEDLMEQVRRERALSEQYENDVRERYGITQRQQSEIVVAGMMWTWAMD